MIKAITLLLALLITNISYATDKNQPLNLTCKDISWDDVQLLVQPYLDDELITALVMQGQSSNYHVSAAASQAIDKNMPEVVQRILSAIIKADC